jgi:3-methylcrotonyl-CoA carboxylase alpha subunit
MFKKILIANRGEIARRIARTCSQMGITVATVHSEADRHAPHVRDIGESVPLGTAPARDSYLSIERVVAAARAVGADAVHPGYGFLAENANFADALQAAGIAFIGPTAQTLRDFGDKAEAKRLAQAAGVPTIPGSPGASADAAEVAAMARDIGLPVLLKAAAGGGGKGIRIVRSAELLDEEIAAAMREGRSAFGDPALLVERYLPQGRHVEVQIIGDGQGGVWHLWDRECSLQRRHQKVVEEAPSLPLPSGLRERLLDAAVALGRQVRYRALGTVEFLVVGDAFFFLEVNPRLQVEHPVTEAVTGLDLVALQIRAAAGAPLGLPASPLRCEGHAIELRLYAEDPEHGFLPATGRLRALRWPADGTRIETGVELGSEVTPHYDPMLAKLVVHGHDRANALARARAALSATAVVGMAHNLAFLEALLARPEVAEGTLDTGCIDHLALQPPRAAWRDAAPAIAAAWVFARSRMPDGDLRPASSWTGLTHWRLNAPLGQPPLHPQYEVAGEHGTQPAWVDCRAGQCGVRLADSAHALEFGTAAADGFQLLKLDGRVLPLALGTEATADGERVWLGDGRHTEWVTVRPALRRARSTVGAAGAALVAPMTGKVLEVRVREGDAVQAGQVLVLIESMKMEMRVAAPQAGIVRAVNATVDTSVERGAVLVSVEAAEEAAP